MSKMTRAFALVGSWTMASRLLGFVRDMLASRIIGAGPVADAFNAAFLLPNLFRRFLAEGALDASFIPQFKKRLDDEDTAKEFAQSTFAGLLFLCLILIAFVQVFTPAAIMLISSGFIGNERFDLAVSYSHITFFYIGFMSLSALCAGVLRSYGRFAIAAAYPLLLNVILVAIYLLAIYLQPASETIGYWLSWGVFLGGVAQFALVYYGMRRMGVKLRPALPVWNADMKALLIVALPVLASSGVGQINLVVGRQIASFTEGAMSWLNYADRLYQLPMGIIGIGVGTVLLPTLSALTKSGDEAAAAARFNEAILFSALFTLPAAVALFAIPAPIVSVIFEGGAFGPEDTNATAKAIMIYALGLPAAVALRAQLQIFYAREETKITFRYAVISMLINVTIAIGLWPYFGFMSAVIASVVSSWAMCFMLAYGARRFGEASQIKAQTWSRLARLLLVSAIMGLLAWWLVNIFEAQLAQSFIQWLVLIAIVSISIIVYFVLAMFALQIHPRQLKAMISR